MITAEIYSGALDRLISRMERVQNTAGPEIAEALDEICSLLRIAKIEVWNFETPWHEAMKNGTPVVIYQKGAPDLLRTAERHEILGNGSTANYVFSQTAGDSDWTDEDKQRISTVEKLIFTFSGRVRFMKLAENLTYTDMQLGVHNINFFMKRAGEMLAKKPPMPYGACYFNLKRFSVVNNQIGRDAGTIIMKRYAAGLEKQLDGDECICRIGGDNFIILFRWEKLNTVIRYLSGTKMDDTQRHASFIISAYMGIYQINLDECRQPSDIVDKVGVAAGIAKKNPNASFIMFNDEVKERVSQSKAIEDMFPEALEKEEFLVYYQPKVDLKDYTLVGAEALCRWRHGGEMIQPFRFIPVLERSKSICELDFYMLEHVCRDMRRWMDEGRKIVKISVNFSRLHLGDANLLEDILKIIDRYEIPHRFIEIELTETTTDVDYSDLKKIVNGLMSQGVSTSVDDFGIGYSSLNLIRELPWNVLKIDKSFLPDGSDNDGQKKTMLKYVIAMAHDLGLKCIVEGVETSEHVMLLKANNCYYAQGYYFDKPLPVDVFEQRLDGKLKEQS